VAACRPNPPPLSFAPSAREGDFEYDEATGWASSPAGVQVTYGDATLTARSVHFTRDSGEVEAEGDVRLQRRREVWSGERLAYNFFLPRPPHGTLPRRTEAGSSSRVLGSAACSPTRCRPPPTPC